MTNERNNGNRAEYEDALVSRTYREATEERAPQHLDAAVLKEAAKAARPRYSRMITWTRPMAWAATVTLCVALVLEINKAPAPSDPTFELDGPSLEREAPKPDVLEEMAPAELPEGRVGNADAPAAPPARAPESIAEPGKKELDASQAARPEAERALRKRQADQVMFRDEQKASRAVSQDDLKLKDADLLQEAEEMARIQSGPDEEAAEALETVTVHGVASFGVIEPTCDEAARATPDEWLECIERLEEAGLDDEAEAQRALLEEAFPDFVAD